MRGGGGGPLDSRPPPPSTFPFFFQSYNRNQIVHDDSSDCPASNEDNIFDQIL